MIGIFGGTFNPIHLGHLRAAEEVLGRLGLGRMIFIPSARPPHKIDGNENIAPASDRLSWVRLAVEGHAHFHVDPIEIERPGPSYLVDTLTHFVEEHPPEDLVFIVGQDAFSEMGDWKSPEKLFAMTNFAVITRPPEKSGHLARWMPVCARGDFRVSEDGFSAEHRKSHHWIRQVPIAPLDISSTRIRKRVSEGTSIKDWVPESVRSAIETSESYRTHPEKSTSPSH